MCDPKPIRLILVARYPVTRTGLRGFLAGQEGVHLVGEASTAPDAVALVLRERPDVVIIDPDAAEVSFSAVPAVAQACETRILVFTSEAEPAVAVKAMELGASGVVCKNQPGEMLIRAVLKVHAGEVWLDRAQTARVLSRAFHRDQDPELSKISSLTKREREIVRKVGEGLRNTAIAEQLFISEATVRNHLTSILGKLQLADRFELAVYAFRHGLVGDEATGSSAQVAKPPLPQAAESSKAEWLLKA